ncbi:MAG TPA: hypothetical protein VII23_20590 [Terriglobales bacterium]
MSLLIWPLQWVKDNPYQTAFWCLPIVLSIVFFVFGGDIRTFIGVKFASFKKKWLQVKYVTELTILARKALYFDHPEILILHILLRVITWAAYFGLFLIIVAFKIRIYPARDHSREAWFVLLSTGYALFYLAFRLMVRYRFALSSEDYLKQTTTVIELRSQLEGFGIDVTVLEKNNGLSSTELLKASHVNKFRH